MTTRSKPLSQSYKEAIQAKDPARALEFWRAAHAPGHETERNIMIQELDFSLVESYSLAQSTDNRNQIAAIWSIALNTPNIALANMLYEIDRLDLESDLQSESEEEDKETDEVLARRKEKTLDFLRGLPGFSFLDAPQNAPEKDAASQGISAVALGISAVALRRFANDPARRSFCGLTDADNKALEALGQALLPKADSQESMQQWAKVHQPGWSPTQIARIQKASLLFQNQMTSTDANTLAMAARSAKGKQEKGPVSSNSPQNHPSSPSNQGSLPE